MTKKERQLQKALGTLLRFNVQLTVPIRAYAETSVLVEDATEADAIKRAKKITVGNYHNLDDDKDHIIWCDEDHRAIGTRSGTHFFWSKIEVKEIDQVE